MFKTCIFRGILRCKKFVVEPLQLIFTPCLPKNLRRFYPSSIMYKYLSPTKFSLDTLFYVTWLENSCATNPKTPKQRVQAKTSRYLVLLPYPPGVCTPAVKLAIVFPLGGARHDDIRYAGAQIWRAVPVPRP